MKIGANDRTIQLLRRSEELVYSARLQIDDLRKTISDTQESIVRTRHAVDRTDRFLAEFMLRPGI